MFSNRMHCTGGETPSPPPHPYQNGHCRVRGEPGDQMAWWGAALGRKGARWSGVAALRLPRDELWCKDSELEKELLGAATFPELRGTWRRQGHRCPPAGRPCPCTPCGPYPRESNFSGTLSTEITGVWQRCGPLGRSASCSGRRWGGSGAGAAAASRRRLTCPKACNTSSPSLATRLSKGENAAVACGAAATPMPFGEGYLFHPRLRLPPHSGAPPHGRGGGRPAWRSLPAHLTACACSSII